MSSKRKFKKLLTLFLLVFCNQFQALYALRNIVAVDSNSIFVDFLSIKDDQGNMIPDFSNVGYMGSECALPKVKVVEEVFPLPSLDADATSLIQKTIDKVSRMPLINGFRGCILIRKGEYRISQSLNIESSGVVLRGEGDATKLIATGKKQYTLIQIKGNESQPHMKYGCCNIKDEYVPVGRFWVRVTNPQNFKIGDESTIIRYATKKWISALGMDKIGPIKYGLKQWEPHQYNLFSERRIVDIVNDTLFFDNPIMMPLDTNYDMSVIVKSSTHKRIKHCGIENIILLSEYGGDFDESHAWIGISVDNAEDCWIDNVTSRYFGYGLVCLKRGCKYTTVSNCRCYDAKSKIMGGRRYSFLIDGAQMCIVRDCETTEGRHDCVTGSKGVGPNVFLRIKSRNTHSDIGPHHRWNVGTLYDNIETDGEINVQDRGNWGTGHGWAGVTQVLWNCNANKVCVQSPWVTGRNYSIGTKAKKTEGRLKGRPDGIWINHNKTAFPISLFEFQLYERIEKGKLYHSKK